MSKTLKDIIEILSSNKIGLDCTYVGENYTKRNLIDDLFALRANYPYTQGDFKQQMDNEVSVSPSLKKAVSKGRKARTAKVKKLIERDGNKCFYCDKDLKIKEITIEHLKATSKGGGNGLKNLKISCLRCNVRAGNLDVSEKLKLRFSYMEPLPEGFASEYSDYTEIK